MHDVICLSLHAVVVFCFTIRIMSFPAGLENQSHKALCHILNMDNPTNPSPLFKAIFERFSNETDFVQCALEVLHDRTLEAAAPYVNLTQEELERLKKARRTNRITKLFRSNHAGTYRESVMGYAKVLTACIVSSNPSSAESIAATRTFVWGLVAFHRLHGLRVVDTALMCLEKSPLVGNVQILRMLRTSLNPAGHTSLGCIIARRLSASEKLGWRRFVALATCVKTGVIPLDLVWACLLKVTANTWKEDGEKYLKTRLAAAHAKKTQVPMDGARDGYLEDAIQENVKAPPTYTNNPCLEFTSALLRVGDFDSALRVLTAYSASDPWAFAPLQPYKRLSVSALRALRELEGPPPMNFLLKMGHRFCEDTQMLCRLLRMPKIMNADFIARVAIPSILCCPSHMPALVQRMPQCYYRLPSSALAAAEVVAARQKMDETVSYCIKRAVPSDARQYGKRLAPILCTYPFAVIDKILNQAVGYSDPLLMATHAQLLTYAPPAITELLFHETISVALEHSKSEGLGCIARVSAMSALLAIMWRNDFGRMDAEKFLVRIFSCNSVPILLCYLRSVLEHLLFLPAFSEVALNATQLRALACGPITKWFTCGSFSLYRQTQVTDEALSFKKWFQNFTTMTSLLQQRNTEISATIGGLQRTILQQYHDGDVTGTANEELLATVRRCYDWCGDLIGVMCPKPEIPTGQSFASALFWRYTLQDILFPEENYTEAKKTIQDLIDAAKSTDATRRSRDDVGQLTNLLSVIDVERAQHEEITCRVRAELQNRRGGLTVMYQDLLLRVRRSPQDAYYSALFLRMETNVFQVEGAIALFLNCVPAYSASESTFVGIFLRTTLEHFTSLRIHASIARILVEVFKNPNEYVHHNALSVLYEIQKEFPLHQACAEAVLKPLRVLASADGPLTPKATAITKYIEGKVLDGAEDVMLLQLLGQGPGTMQSRQRKAKRGDL